jgi:succinate dehydrogenase/fumarate reductase flavoprotein subunit
MFILKNVYREEAGNDGAGAGGTADSGAAAAGTGAVSLNSDNWKDFVSEDLRSSDSLSKFTNLDALAKSYINAESMIGKDKIVMPETEEQWGETYNRLGRPESSDAYALQKIEGIDLDGDFISGFKNTAHASGLSQKQVSEMFGWYNSMAKGILDSDKSSAEIAQVDAENALRSEWGERYNSNLEIAKRSAAEYGGDDFVNFMNSAGLDKNPAMLKFLSKVGQTISEDNLEGNGQTGGGTPDQIREEIDTIMGSTAYQSKADPSHNASVKKVQALFNRLHSAAA